MHNQKNNTYIFFRVKSFDLFEDEDELSEYTYLRKFENVLECMFSDTKLKMKDGETVSKSTKRNQIFNDYNESYGHRIDLLVTTKKKDDLCSVEFKKQGVSNKPIHYQQSKNLRINACILNDAQLMTRSTEKSLLYMDFIGREGYLAQIFRFEDVFVTHKIDSIYIPKTLIELIYFKSSLKSLYIWKLQLVDLCNKLTIARFEEERHFSQIEYSESVSPRSPSSNITPIKIFLSPNKRSWDVYERDQ